MIYQKITFFFFKQVEVPSNDDGLALEEDSLERYYENLNNDNLINDNDSVLDASNIDVDINNLSLL